jgi:hypothetical protein
MKVITVQRNYSNALKKHTEEAILLFLYYFSHALILFTPVIIGIALYSMISRGMPPYAWVVPVINAVILFFIAYWYRHLYQQSTPPFYWFIIFMAFGPWFLLITSLNNIYLYSGQYIGVFESIDGIIFILMACPLAFSPSIKTIITLCFLHLCVMALVVVAELRFANPSPAYDVHHFSTWIVWYLFAVCFTLAISRHIRRLLLNATTAVLAKRNKQQVIQDMMNARHDSLSIISSAKLNLALVLRGLRDEKKNSSMLRLEADLVELENLIELTKRYATNENNASAITLDIIPDFFGEIRRLANHLASKSSAIEFTLDLPKSVVSLLFMEAHVGLRRVIENAYNNSVEGTGGQCATRFHLAGSMDASGIHLVLQDNGPGFPSGGLPTGYTSKSSGSGTGTIVIKELIFASRGTVQFANNKLFDGAAIVIWLPAASQ